MIFQRLFAVSTNVLQHINRQSRVLPSFITSRSHLSNQSHTFGLLSVPQNSKNILNGADFTKSTSIVPNNFWSLNSARTKVRIYFPRPNEVKRVTKFGWFARMKTPGGRAVLMRRILRGRHVLSH